MHFTIATKLEEARRGRGEDRIAIVEASNRKIVLVADGAGGVGGGAAAAEALCKASGDVSDWAEWLKQQDTRLAAQGTGLAAAVVLSVDARDEIHGASVGDCEAWVFTQQGEAVNLTANQVRKPLLGDGAALPVSFTWRMAIGETLVVASDGLWKYIGIARVADSIRLRRINREPLETVGAALVDSLRLRSGALQDDVAIVILKVAQP